MKIKKCIKSTAIILACSIPPATIFGGCTYGKIYYKNLADQYISNFELSDTFSPYKEKANSDLVKLEKEYEEIKVKYNTEGNIPESYLISKYNNLQEKKEYYNSKTFVIDCMQNQNEYYTKYQSLLKSSSKNLICSIVFPVFSALTTGLSALLVHELKNINKEEKTKKELFEKLPIDEKYKERLVQKLNDELYDLDTHHNTFLAMEGLCFLNVDNKEIKKYSDKRKQLKNEINSLINEPTTNKFDNQNTIDDLEIIK